MQKVLASDDHFARKALLKLRISEAIAGDKSKLLSLYQSQWVHRYGLETLPTDLDAQKHLDQNESSEKVFAKVSNVLDDEMIEEPISSKENELTERSVKTNEISSTSLEKESTQITESDLLDGRKDHSDHDLQIPGEEINNKNEQSTLILAAKDKKSISSPPPLALNHLRKWLPSNKTRKFTYFPKAS